MSLSRVLQKKDAKAELESALERHLEMLSTTKEIAITRNKLGERFLYLMAIPIIYAAWEGFFRVSMAICLKRTCVKGRKANSYSKGYVGLWLQKQGFVESFVRNLLNAMNLGSPIKAGPGRFLALSEFSRNHQDFLAAPFNHLEDFDKLVMTYSNVNGAVVELNCRCIGLDSSKIDLSRLNELLNRRNDIAHGGLLDYPRLETVAELIEYTTQLMKSFNAETISWIRTN